jgi:hypothetical protein
MHMYYFYILKLLPHFLGQNIPPSILFTNTLTNSIYSYIM